jgi:cytochrome c-type biogenesis protein CcmH
MTNRHRVALAFSVFVAIATALVPLRVNAERSDRAKALGRKLMCMCGCGQILIECNHIDCPYSVPMLKKLDQLVAANEADDLILQDYVQQYGEKVLSEPPSKGFNSIAWYIPGASFVLGLAIVGFVIRLWSKRHTEEFVPASGAPVEGAAPSSARPDSRLERARRQADEETED